jgi:hypothetical protein
VTELADARPARFAQLVGFVLTATALVAFVVGADVAGVVLTAVVLIVTVMEAATGVCLGCRVYALVRRHRVRA